MRRSKQQKQSYSLFEPEALAEAAEERSAKSEPIAENKSLTIDPTACPKCGHASQETAHPNWHDGCTRYCIFCVTDGEPYYFVPKSEAPF